MAKYFLTRTTLRLFCHAAILNVLGCLTLFGGCSCSLDSLLGHSGQGSEESDGSERDPSSPQSTWRPEAHREGQKQLEMGGASSKTATDSEDTSGADRRDGGSVADAENGVPPNESHPGGKSGHGASTIHQSGRSPDRAQREGQRYLARAKRYAKRDDYQAAFDLALSAWQLTQPHNNHPGCSRVAEDAMGLLEKYGELVEASANARPAGRKILKIE